MFDDIHYNRHHEQVMELTGTLRDVHRTFYGNKERYDVRGEISFFAPIRNFRGASVLESMKFYDIGIRHGQDKNLLREGTKVRFKCTLWHPKRCWDIRLDAPPNLVLVERPRYAVETE